MRHLYPIDRKQTFYYKHVEPVLKGLAVLAIIGFLTAICLTLTGNL